LTPKPTGSRTAADPHSKENTMGNPDFLPDISEYDLDELLALRAAIDARLEEKRNALLAEAERVEGVIANGAKKRRGRKPKDETQERTP
jgi:hypothetical protein